MKLCVPTNWQPDLLDKINKTKVMEIYGKLDRDPVGGGRPSFMLAHINKSRVKEYISAVKKCGLKFNYLLNAVCLGNAEWSASGQKRIRDFLDWLSAIGVDTVTVSIPYLLELVKRHYPHFETKVSVCAQVCDPLQAKYWEDLGADEISLSPWNINRDFKTLKKIRKAVRCKLQVYANTRCLSGCPFVQYHYSSHSHSSRTNDRESTVNYCKFSCNYLILKQPQRLISACWIRPEDLAYYEKAGINTIKLSERGMETRQIQRIVEAYTAQSYSGNLMDLLCVIPAKRLAIGKSRKTRTTRFTKLLNQMLGNDLTFLDNNKLDGFLNFFIEGKCNRINCDTCGYCRSIANKALYIPKDYRAKLISYYEGLLASIIGKEIFTLIR
ncbi:MAG: U32 family peptidase [Candidatus Omnitrophota bacterium]